MGKAAELQWAKYILKLLNQAMAKDRDFEGFGAKDRIDLQNRNHSEPGFLLRLRPFAERQQ